jgi:hypothetical protein
MLICFEREILLSGGRFVSKEMYYQVVVDKPDDEVGHEHV